MYLIVESFELGEGEGQLAEGVVGGGGTGLVSMVYVGRWLGVTGEEGVSSRFLFSVVCWAGGWGCTPHSLMAG